MKTPEEILLSRVMEVGENYFNYLIPGIVAAMEEYKDQFIDFDGPIARIDHYHRIAKDLSFELGNANEIIKLREKELQNAKDEIFRLQEIIHNTTRL